MIQRSLLNGILACLAMASAADPATAALPWTSQDRCRILLTVDMRGVAQRSHSPASVDLDFAAAMAARQVAGTFDPDTIEVIAYDAAGNPRVFDPTRAGQEQYLLPWRVQLYYGSTRATLSFVVPDQTCTRYAVYFDTTLSGHAHPDRYPGIVGDGDRFTDGYHRREVNACGYDTFADFDGDGDLDLFKAGTEPFIYCYENVGSARFVDRGRMTSGGQLFQLPMEAGSNRSWASIEFCDWDADGDQDLFIYSVTGPYGGKLARFENTGLQPLAPVFTDRGPLLTTSGATLSGPVSFIDWDGDGKLDLVGGDSGRVLFFRNTGTTGGVASMQVADGVTIQANGVPIQVMSPRIDCADIDADGDLDLFIGTEEGRVFTFENVGTRSQPVFAMGRLLAFYEYMDARARVKVADFDGDGLLDFVVGRYWERTQWGEQPRVYGRLYRNTGTPSSPRFVARDAQAGAPCTQRFQPVDAVRQNGFRVADWNNDGRLDLIAGDTDGFVWWFRNTASQLFPVFAPGERLTAAGVPLRVYGELRECRAAGYARPEVCDWNGDGKKDLLVADGRGWLFCYLNTGTDAAPVLGPGTRIQANGKPIDGTARGSVLVCDWNNDGKKDVIFGMAGEGELSDAYDWPHVNADPSQDRGFLFYRNIGTDTTPLLDAPKWVTAGTPAAMITYPSRPNLGAFVDWDGDGDRDFIGCGFENNAQLFINTAGVVRNSEPRLASGITIVQPWTFQMMSGADAVDWNRDGDIDIITGQGHGGSGVRFYERDYINDFVNQTFPIVTPGETESLAVAADLDSDGDVDQEDFGLFQLCYSGDGQNYTAGCAAADLDLDFDVDLDDFVVLSHCLGGPDQPPHC